MKPNPTPNGKPRTGRSLAAIVGTAACAALMLIVPKFEGTKLKTYRDPVGILTYCTGETLNAEWGKTYTVAECQATLEKSLAKHAEGVAACIKVPLTDGQAVAFVDTAYNIGIAGFCGSSMARYANKGDMPAACASLSLWTKAGGRELPGLVTRRAIAREYCEGKRKV